MKNTYLIGLAFLFGCSSKPAPQSATPPSLPVIAVTAGEVTTFSQYPASIEGTDNVEIRPQVSGTLQEVYVDEGAFVHAGQLLFRIDQRPFQAALENALASLHAAESASQNANLEVEKVTPLVQNKVVSDYQLKTATVTADGARANIEQAKANVKTARINLAYTLITAPVDGYIGRLLKKKGSLVGPSDPGPLTDLSDVQHVHVYFSLGENDFVSFKEQYPGETLKEKLKNLPPVTLLLPGDATYGQKGRVDMIDGQFDKNTGAITIRADFPNEKGLLRSGNTGKVQLSLLHKNALLVPQAATIEVQDRIFVFALADSNKVKKLAITVTGRSGNNYVVGGGLKSGDRIVTEGLGSLQEGAVIAPINSPKIAANEN